MTYYEITNKTSGAILGVLAGDDPSEALGALHEIAGTPPEDLSGSDELEIREVEVTAAVTARAEESTVPDNPGAVDAMVYVCGRELGEVTLLPPGNRRYSTHSLLPWGSLENWASEPVMYWIDCHPNKGDAIGAITDAVCKAAEKGDDE